MDARSTTVAASISAGAAVVLGVSTIIGGLWAYGAVAAGLILLIALTVTIVKFRWIQHSDTQRCLGRSGFRLPSPSWLTIDDRHNLEGLALGALLLLAFDRTPSGCWGKSYLYRRHISGSGVPLSRGSLTGTPFGLLAIASSTQLTEDQLHKWAFQSLNGTLANILTNTGQYRTGFRIGQTGRVEEFETVRHASGGFLTALLSGSVSSRNLATLEAICRTPVGPTAWDMAIVCRTLLQASHSPLIKPRLRRQARRRYLEVLSQVLKMANQVPTSALIWTDPYDYGSSANNQWASVWALLPSVADPQTPQSVRAALRDTLRDLLLAQEAASPNPDAGLASSVDAAGAGSGFHVLGTAVSALGWRFLNGSFNSPLGSPELDRDNSTRAVRRLINSGDLLLEKPSQFDATDPLSLEGYFGWTGVLFAIASVGVTISEHDALRILRTAGAMEAVPTDLDHKALVERYLECLVENGFFDKRTNEILAQSASRVTVLYREVNADRGPVS